MPEKTYIQMINRLLGGTPSDDDISTIVERFSILGADILASNPKGCSLEDETMAQVSIVKSSFSEHLDTLLNSQSLEDRFSIASTVMVTHPELILPLGYDDVRYSPLKLVDPELSWATRGLVEEIKSETVPPDKIPIGAILLKAAQYRTPDGTWHDCEGVVERLLPGTEGLGPRDHRPFEYWYELLRTTWLQGLSVPDRNPNHSVTFPSLWVPRTDKESLLHTATRATLFELSQGSTSLDQMHWRTLEELVAELLRDLGLEVVVTPRSHDGGRDVVARGELIPGEPSLLAVEVKHRKVVPVSELRAALWANRQFPALLFVTSGRFSAGVYREKCKEESKLRLFLKDGMGLTQWIDQYVENSLRTLG